MSKVIDYDKIVRESFLKAQRDLGLHKESQEKTLLAEQEENKTDLNIYDSLDSIKFKSGDWGRKGTVAYEELSYFTNKIREMAVGTSKGSIEEMPKIITKINNILGFKEEKLGDTKLGYAVPSGRGAENVNELTTALYLANIIHGIILKQTSGAVAGGVWEGFIANLLGGKLPSRKEKVAPIQDIIDGNNNYVSLKVIGQGASIVGSKHNLALAISQRGKVYYLVAFKTQSAAPFKIIFRLFEVTKENYFQIITNDKNAISPEGVLSTKVKQHIQKMKGELKESFLSEASLEDPYQQQAIAAAEKSGDFEKEIENIKSQRMQEIDQMAEELEETREKLAILFSEFIYGDDNHKFIKFTGTVKQAGKEYQKYPLTIDLSDKEKFSDSMKKFWINQKRDKVFKKDAYDEFISPMLTKFASIPDISDNEPDKQLELIKKYDYNPTELSQSDLQKIVDLNRFDKQLKAKNNNLIAKIADINPKVAESLKDMPFEKIFAEYIANLNPKSQEMLDIQEAISESYDERKDIYRQKHQVFFEELKKVFGAFAKWYADASKHEASAAKKISKEKSQALAKSYPASSKELEDFWNFMSTTGFEKDESIKGEGLLREGSTYKDTQFSIGLSSLSEITHVREDIPDFIVSQVDLKQTAEANVNMLKEILKPYYDAFNMITLGTREYFVKDEPNGMKKVNEGIAGIQKVQSEKLTDAGSFKKASELKEVLNMTREAAIVLEMLQRMEE